MKRNNIFWENFKLSLREKKAYRTESEDRVNDKTVCSLVDEE